MTIPSYSLGQNKIQVIPWGRKKTLVIKTVIAPAVRKDAPELLNWLNNEIQTLGKDGRLKQAYEKTLLPVYGDTVSESDIVVEYK